MIELDLTTPSRELDAAVAVAMGLPVVWNTPPYVAFGSLESPPVSRATNPYLRGRVGGVHYDWADCPYYSWGSPADTRPTTDMLLWLLRQGGRVSMSDLGPAHSTNPGLNVLVLLGPEGTLVNGDGLQALALALCAAIVKHRSLGA